MISHSINELLSHNKGNLVGGCAKMKLRLSMRVNVCVNKQGNGISLWIVSDVVHDFIVLQNWLLVAKLWFWFDFCIIARPLLLHGCLPFSFKSICSFSLRDIEHWLILIFNYAAMSYVCYPLSCFHSSRRENCFKIWLHCCGTPSVPLLLFCRFVCNISLKLLFALSTCWCLPG